MKRARAKFVRQALHGIHLAEYVLAVVEIRLAAGLVAFDVGNVGLGGSRIVAIRVVSGRDRVYDHCVRERGRSRRSSQRWQLCDRSARRLNHNGATRLGNKNKKYISSRLWALRFPILRPLLQLILRTPGLATGTYS